MQDFNNGPFSFTRSKTLNINGVEKTQWSMHYGPQELAMHTIAAATQAEVLEAFHRTREMFIIEAASAAPEIKSDDLPPLRVQLIEHSTGRVVAGWFDVMGEIKGLTPGLTDDRWPTWMVTLGTPMRSLPMALDEYQRLAIAHSRAEGLHQQLRQFKADQHKAPRAWIASLLPDDVLTTDVEQWRAPSAWEIRHLVGEGSFTGLSGAKAAALLGISPQNWRKYTAADTAKTRQPMSYAMWHLLLLKLGVQRV